MFLGLRAALPGRGYLLPDLSIVDVENKVGPIADGLSHLLEQLVFAPESLEPVLAPHKAVVVYYRPGLVDDFPVLDQLPLPERVEQPLAKLLLASPV